MDWWLWSSEIGILEVYFIKTIPKLMSAFTITLPHPPKKSRSNKKPSRKIKLNFLHRINWNKNHEINTKQKPKKYNLFSYFTLLFQMSLKLLRYFNLWFLTVLYVHISILSFPQTRKKEPTMGGKNVRTKIYCLAFRKIL